MPLEEPAFDALVAQLFRELVAALDEVDPDLLEAEATTEMISITAAGGEKVILNTQRAVRQLWVAGAGQGIHFTYEPVSGRWLDDRGLGVELKSFLTRCVGEASGVQLPLGRD